MQADLCTPPAPVLVFAEDDPDWGFLFCLEFRKQAPHWKIICTREGADAIRALEKVGVPRALVTDLQMPQVGGFELIAWVRNQHQLKSLPVFVSSIHEGPDQQRRCAELQVEHVLPKTGSLSALRDNIRTILQRCEGFLAGPSGATSACVS